MTIVEAGAALRRRELRCVDLTERCLERIEESNPKLNAFVTVTADAARARARELDEELARGRDRGPMHGIPIAHKDILRTKGVRTTCGSLLFADDVPEIDAEVVEKLEAAGAVSVGKTGLHELAYGITSDNPHFGTVRNPCDPERIPGGSSGGSGAAVAAGMALGATGTDTGGSIRIPASFCGVFGLKPTYGLLSCAGIQPLGLSLDHVGPIAGDSAGAAAMLRAMGDGREVEGTAESTLKGVRVGVPENYYFDNVDAEVAAAVRGAIERTREVGAEIVAVRVPDMETVNAVGRTILLAEASAVYRPWIGHRERFGADVLALLEQGLLVAAVDYVNAQRLRRRLAREFAAVFDEVDCLITPTTPTAAPRIGERAAEIGGKPMDVRLAATSLVRGINVMGLPALSMPCGRTAAGLPIGLHIVGRAYGEREILRVSAALEIAPA